METMSDIHFAQPTHIPSKKAPEFELVDAVVCPINPQQASTLRSDIGTTQVKRLGEVSPIKELGHLKRIAKKRSADGGADQLHIILWEMDTASLAESISSQSLSNGQPCRLPAAVQAVVAEFGLTPEVRKVPLYAPITKDQLMQWGEHWPITWRPPDPHLLTKPGEIDGTLVRHMEQCMRECVRGTEALSGNGYKTDSSCNTAIITDPYSGQVIAKGVDNTGGHPLQHAVMVALEEAAARDRRLWPGPSLDGQEEQGEPKRQRVGEAPPAGPKPFLCTGLECYVIREPCAMCAMALVHSRVSRVVYSRADLLHGALGGSYCLHQERSLNHHYEVYHLALAPVTDKTL